MPDAPQQHLGCPYPQFITRLNNSRNYGPKYIQPFRIIGTHHLHILWALKVQELQGPQYADRHHEVVDKKRCRPGLEGKNLPCALLGLPPPTNPF